MILSQLRIHQFRNISTVEIYPIEKFNIFYGLNGSGKTSLLEAIYYLGLNRSFRSHINNRIIQYEKENFQLYAKFGSLEVGLEKDIHKKTTLHINQQLANSITEITKQLPIQLIDTQSYEFIDQGPEFRRQLLDWGVFYVEHSFAALWKSYQICLQQRNSAIKQQLPIKEILAWDEKLSQAGNKLTELRVSYITKLLPFLKETLQQFTFFSALSVDFKQGWPEAMSLEEAIKQSIHKDLQVGYTTLGPHRADLVIKSNKISLKDSLSRGEKKLLVMIVKIAQGKLLKQLKNLTTLYLIDDLSSEVDKFKQAQIMELLEDLAMQYFITTINKLIFNEYANTTQLFHVEQGNIVID